MSRVRNFLLGIASSYVVLVATAAYSFAAVPLTLHYLSKEQFGLWALMLQLASYLQLVDLGISSSLPRILVEHKDTRGSPLYGSALITAWVALLAPAAGTLTLGALAAPYVADLVAVPAHLHALFTSLLRWQCALAAVGFGTRVLGALLIANQRIDYFNYSNLLYFSLSFPVLWFNLTRGEGVFSFMWAQWAGTLISTGANVLACRHLMLFPKAGEWGRPSWNHLRPVLNYGKDLFLVTLGTQLIIASQTMIIARFLSLEASGIWTAGSRVFQLVCQAVWRMSDVCGAAFAEMLIRGETQSLQARYRELVTLTASLATYAAVGLALCNSPFVTLWTNGKLAWPMINDLLMGIWLVLLAIGHCHNGFVLLTKEVGFMRYIYFIEGAASVALASLFLRRGGIPSMITVSILSMLTLDFAYGVIRVSRYFEITTFQVAIGWLVPTGRFLTWYLPASLVWYLITRHLEPAKQFAGNAAFCLTVGSVILLKLGLSHDLQEEVARRSPPSLRSAFRLVFSAKARCRL